MYKMGIFSCSYCIDMIRNKDEDFICFNCGGLINVL